MLILDFFHSIRTFYAWVFPLNMMVIASMLAGLTVGLLPRRGAWTRRISAGICACILLAAEIVSYLYNSEALMFVAICGWFAEAALLSCAVGTAAQKQVLTGLTFSGQGETGRKGLRPGSSCLAPGRIPLKGEMTWQKMNCCILLR